MDWERESNCSFDEIKNDKYRENFNDKCSEDKFFILDGNTTIGGNYNQEHGRIVTWCAYNQDELTEEKAPMVAKQLDPNVDLAQLAISQSLYSMLTRTPPIIGIYEKNGKKFLTMRRARFHPNNSVCVGDPKNAKERLINDLHWYLCGIIDRDTHNANINEEGYFIGVDWDAISDDGKKEKIKEKNLRFPIIQRNTKKIVMVIFLIQTMNT